MAQVPPGRLSRGTIIAHALERAGNPKIRNRMRTQLNLILDDLYIEWDWPFLHEEVSINLGQNFPLPDDFLQTYDDAGLIVTASNGQLMRHRVYELSRVKFEKCVRAGEVSADLPSIWHPDREQGIGLIFPVNTAAATAMLRYRKRPVFVTVGDKDSDPINATYDVDIPVFPFARYLIDAVYQCALEYEKDPRADSELVKLEQKLSRIRNTILPPGAIEEDLALDDTVFTAPYIPEG